MIRSTSTQSHTRTTSEHTYSLLRSVKFCLCFIGFLFSTFCRHDFVIDIKKLFKFFTLFSISIRLKELLIGYIFIRYVFCAYWIVSMNSILSSLYFYVKEMVYEIPEYLSQMNKTILSDWFVWNCDFCYKLPFKNFVETFLF